MVKNVPNVCVSEFPKVLIKYEPQIVLSSMCARAIVVADDAEAIRITNAKTLEKASDVLTNAQKMSEQIDQFRGLLTERVQEAATVFHGIKGMEDLEITVTIRKWSLRKRLEDMITGLRGKRARFMQEEQERVAALQREADRKQSEANKKAADEAAKKAAAMGADKGTVAEIKRDVLATAAPIVQSKAVAVASTVGAGLRYDYKANITDLRAFLIMCLNNPVFFTTMGNAIPAIEKAFDKMASDQKDGFSYAGITFRKIPVDVNRARR